MRFLLALALLMLPVAARAQCTAQTQAQLLTAFADNTTNAINAQDFRNLVCSSVNITNGALTNPTMTAGSWANAGLSNPTMSTGSWAGGLLTSPTMAGVVIYNGTVAAPTPLTVAPSTALTGNSATAAAISATATGSGTNGPGTAQTALTLNLTTPNYPTTAPTIGEIDPLTIFFRQSHPGSDGSGLLINGQNTGLGFTSATEFTMSIYDTGSNAITRQIGVQEAVLNLPGTDYHGAAYTALLGNMSSAIRVQNVTGVSTWGLVMDNIKNGTTNFFINDAGVVSASGYQVGATVGVDCAANTVSLTTLVVSKGMVTHC